MTRTRRTIATALAATLLVAGCGGGSGATTAPASTGPAATTAPAATAGPSSQASGGAGIGGAVTALGDLTSYKFAIGMAAEGSASFTLLSDGGSMTISGTVITQPAAMDMAMTTTDKTGASATFAYKVVDGKAYVSMAPDQWMETSAADAQSTIDSFKPEKFMSSFGSLDTLQVVGDETKNGVATTHYKGTAPAEMGALFGLPTGTWTMEAWVAKDGGFLVSSALTGEATDGKFTMTMDVTDLNSPANTVVAPASFTPIGG